MQRGADGLAAEPPAEALLDDPATLATRRTLLLTRTGLSPVGSRQLRLAHANSFSIVDRHQHGLRHDSNPTKLGLMDL